MRSFLVCVFAALLAGYPAGATEMVKLTTLHWPPYVLSDGSGPNTETVTAVFARAGHAVQIEVFPWNRAITLAAQVSEWIGVFPEYYAADIDAERMGTRCLFSEPFGESPVGFLKRRDSAFTWRSHTDLKSYVIGVVRGYVNEQQFDQMIAGGEIVGELAESDEENIRKLAAGRADVIVIDQRVYEYLVANIPDIAILAAQLEFHEKLLARHGLYVCFENSPDGRKFRDLFNAHLTEDLPAPADRRSVRQNPKIVAPGG